MSQVKVFSSRYALRSVASLALIAPVLVGSAIALSSRGDGPAPAEVAAQERAAGMLHSTQIRTIDLASLPASAFGDAE